VAILSLKNRIPHEDTFC